MSSDSTYFDMRSVPLRPALEIAFSNAPGGKAWGYKSTPDRLTFAWHESAGKDFVPFVTPVSESQAKQIVQDWINEVAEFSPQPDHDGDNEKSFRIFCEAWGHVDHNYYAFVAIEPYWAQYGK